MVQDSSGWRKGKNCALQSIQGFVHIDQLHKILPRISNKVKDRRTVSHPDKSHAQWPRIKISMWVTSQNPTGISSLHHSGERCRLTPTRLVHRPLISEGRHTNVSLVFGAYQVVFWLRFIIFFHPETPLLLNCSLRFCLRYLVSSPFIALTVC